MSSTLNKQMIDDQMTYARSVQKEKDLSTLRSAMEVTGDDEYDLGIDSMYWFKIVHVCKHY